MTLAEFLILALATVGTLFMLISAIGILRLPDVYTRMHANGKAGTLGVSCLLLAAGLFYGGTWLPRMIILIALFFITAPIATTAMARAAYRVSDFRERFELRYDDIARDGQISPEPTAEPDQEISVEA